MNRGIGVALLASIGLLALSLFVLTPRGPSTHPFLSPAQPAAAWLSWGDEEDDVTANGDASPYAPPVQYDNYYTYVPTGLPDDPLYGANSGYIPTGYPDDPVYGVGSIYDDYVPTGYPDDPLYGTYNGYVAAYADDPYSDYIPTGYPDDPIYGATSDYIPTGYPDDPGYGNPSYDYLYNYAPVQAPPTWYEKMLPGIASSLIHILPPVAQPQYTPPPTPRPSCSINANPTQVTYGGATTVSWNSQYASNASIGGLGSVPVSGSSLQSNLTATRVFGLTVNGKGGANTCTVQVNVAAAERPTCIISVNPSGIGQGQSASLAWGSSGATRATLSNFGTVSVQGGTSVAPLQSTLYVLTVYNQAGQSGTCSASLGVYAR